MIDKKFWNDICKFSMQLKEEDDIFIVSHHDADGITACAVLIDLFRFLEKDVEYMITKQLNSNTINKIDNIDKTIVFSDMGSGQIPLIIDSGIKNFYIIDHHTPHGEYKKQVNPHFYGYDGGVDISGAGMAYLVAKSLNRDKMAHIALVGAVGDMQDFDGRLHSLNRIILNDAIKQKTIKVKNDLRLFGRQSRPLHIMLTYASDPIIPGLTGNQRACLEFIESLEINPKREDDSWKSYVDLSIEERKKLISALYIRLLDFNVPEYIIQGMIGEVYTLLKEERRTELRDVKEFSTLMNACGRHERPEIGLNVCLGDRDRKWKEAKKLLQRHREMLREGIEYLSERGVKELPFLYYFDSEGRINENIIGVVAGMAYGARIIPPDKPILAFADDKDDSRMMKVSARANWNLIRRGIHLGNAMNECSAMVDGEGGGHDIAAGARIPKEKRNEFITAVNDIFKCQIEKKI